MRLISFALTCDQVLAQTKTQTRRLGWRFAKVGDRLRGVRKVQGRGPNEPIVDVAIVEITAIRRERLDAITPEDLVREGFPELTPAGFCQLFPCEPSDEVTVVDFCYLDREVLGRLEGLREGYHLQGQRGLRLMRPLRRRGAGAARGGASQEEIRTVSRWLDGARTLGARLAEPKPGTLDAVRHLLIRHGIEVPS